MGSHYSYGQRADLLGRWAKYANKKLDAMLELHASGAQPILCYRGMSGVSHATALAIQRSKSKTNFGTGMLYVRKPDEKSHGDLVEYDFALMDTMEPSVLVFVDDFVAFGETCRATITEAQNWIRSSSYFQKPKPLTDRYFHVMMKEVSLRSPITHGLFYETSRSGHNKGEERFAPEDFMPKGWKT